MTIRKVIQTYEFVYNDNELLYQLTMIDGVITNKYYPVFDKKEHIGWRNEDCDLYIGPEYVGIEAL